MTSQDRVNGGRRTVSTDAVAQDQIKAFTDRILRMRQEAQAIKDDIKEIYAEAKGNGFDKTVLGNLVRHLEKSSDDHAADMERGALFELYLAAYQGTPSRTHAHARESDDESDHSPDAGNKVTHPATDPKQVTAAAAVPPNSESEEGGTAGTGAALLATNMPETANDLPSGEPANAGGENEAVAQDIVMRGADLSAEVVAHEQLENVKRDGASESAPVSAVEAGAPRKLKMNREFFDAPHPSCQRPEFCGGNSNLGLCQSCKEAAGLVPANGNFVTVEHQGTIN